MLVMRLARRGRKAQAFYDLVLAEKSRPVKKRFIAKLGYYNPLTDNGVGEVVFDKDLVEKHIGNGAQCSQSVARLLAKNGCELAGKFIEARVTKPKKEAPAPEVTQDAAPEAAAQAEAPATEETPSSDEEKPETKEAPAEANEEIQTPEVEKNES